MLQCLYRETIETIGKHTIQFREAKQHTAVWKGKTMSSSLEKQNNMPSSLVRQNNTFVKRGKITHFLVWRNLPSSLKRLNWHFMSTQEKIVMESITLHGVVFLLTQNPSIKWISDRIFSHFNIVMWQFLFFYHLKVKSWSPVVMFSLNKYLAHSVMRIFRMQII